MNYMCVKFKMFGWDDHRRILAESDEDKTPVRGGSSLSLTDRTFVNKILLCCQNDESL